MACEKHKIRKRKDCPDCCAESGLGELSKEAVEQLTNATTPKVALEMAATAGAIAKIPSRLQQVSEEVTFSAEKLLEEPPVELDLDEYRDFKNEQLKQEVDLLVKKKLKDVEKEINKMMSIRHEALDIPLNRFNLKVMDSLLADGWKLIAFLTKDLAKLSGLKEDSVIMQRVKCDAWKKDLESYKLRFKE